MRNSPTPAIALLLLVALGGAGARSVSAQQYDPADPIPPDPAVRTGTLANGLTYFVHENDEPENRAALRLVVNAGSILEEDDQLGLAHFVEHMAFNGTRNFEKQELVDYLESIGMQFGPGVNAYTGFDETVYMLTIPVDDPEIVATAFQILVDWAGGVGFDPEEVDKERGVIIEEWRGRRGGLARIQDEQIPVMFHGSRYADRLPIGDPEIVESAPVERLRSFYADWYRPDLMAVVAVGDFDGDEIESMIQDYFGALANPENPRPRTEAEVPIDHPPLVTIATDPEMPQTQVGVLYKQAPSPRGTIADFRRARVRSLYSGMLNERLGELTVQADPPFLAAGAGGGSLVRGVEASEFYAGVTEDGIERGLDALLTEAERVARHGFSASELEREKASLRRSYEARLAEAANRSSSALAGRYVDVFLTGNPFPSVETEMALLDAVLPGITLEETNAYAQDWLTERGRVISVAGPQKEGLATPTEDDVTAVFAAVSAKEIAPYEDSEIDAPLIAEIPEGSPVVSEESVDEIGVTIWELANGVRVVLKPTDFRDDQVIFSGTSPGGISLASDEHFHNAGFAGTAASQGGVGEFDQIALGKKLTGKRAAVSAGIGSLTESISGSASPQDLETAFQLIYLRFTAPRRDETAFEAFRAQQLGVMANMGAIPVAALQDTLAVVLGQGHPRAPVTLARRLEIVQNADLDVALDFYRDRFADASDFTFYFVGTFDLAGIRPFVETYLGGLPNLGREESWIDHGMDPPPGVIEKVVRKGVEPQSQTLIAFLGDAEYSPEESAVLGATAEILQISLRELLREDLGGTYGVSVGGGIDYRPDEEYAVQIQFGSDPERAEELAAVVFEEIERLKTEGPTAENVTKVREQQRRSKETSLQQNGYWLGQLSSFESRGLDIRLIPSYDLIEGWTAEQVQAAANRYLRTDRYVKFVLLPDARVG